MALEKILSATVKILLLLPLISLALNAAAAPLVVEDAWIKLAPPGSASHAAYVRFTNNNKQAVVITRVSAIGYAQAMLHQTKIVNDKVHMEHSDVLEIAGETSVTFTPGAAHLMLMQPQQSQKLNDQVNITLTFKDGTRQQFMALVRAQ